MVKNAEYVDHQKQTWLMGHPLALEEKFAILNALYEEARLFGHFSQHDLQLGLEDDVRLAAQLNANVSSPPR